MRSVFSGLAVLATTAAFVATAVPALAQSSAPPAAQTEGAWTPPRSALSSAIPTLSSVQVRPTAGQIVELAAEQAAAQLATHTPVAIGASIGQWMVSLPAITVRPDARQVKALATELAADTLGEVANGMVAK